MRRDVIARALIDHIWTELEDCDNRYDFPHDERLIKEHILCMNELFNLENDDEQNITNSAKDLRNKLIDNLEYSLTNGLLEIDKSWQHEEIAVLLVLGEEKKARDWASKYEIDFNDCIEASKSLTDYVGKFNVLHYNKNMETRLFYNKDMRTQLLKSCNSELNCKNIKYWSNSCGDLFNPFAEEKNVFINENALPEQLKEAWNSIWYDGYGSYCYLVQLPEYKDENGYGILLVNEYLAEDGYAYTDVENKSKLVKEMLTAEKMLNCLVGIEEYTNYNSMTEHNLNVFIPWNTPKKNVQKIADFLLDVAYYRGVNTYEDYKNYADNLSGTEFINTLMPGYRNRIQEALFEILPEITDHYDEYDINEIMSGRLCDLEDNMNWREALKNGDIRKDVPYFKNMKDEVEEER